MDPTSDQHAARGFRTGFAADLPVKATERIDQLVDLLRDKSVRPLTLAARAIMFGVIVFAATVVTVTLLSITFVRILTVYAFDGRVWLSDLVVGLLWVTAGLLLWWQRTARGAEAGPSS
ncbi:MAG: hypothetical protein WB565_04105 [Acidimicrobiales bacterium]